MLAEPRRTFPLQRTGERCPNCGTETLGRYCHACGQQHRDLPSLRSFFAEALGDLFSFDGRLWRTLRPLLLHPGRLSAEYLAGRRARHVPPFRLYLLVSVLYFGVLALTGSRSFFFFHPGGDGEQAARFVQLLPRLMFVVLPAFALLLQLLFRRTWRLYLEHLVVTLYYHAFAFLALSAHTLLEAYLLRTRWSLLSGFVAAADVLLQVWVFAYLFRTLRRVYGESRPSTIAKGILLLAGYLGILILAGAAVIQASRLAP